MKNSFRIGIDAISPAGKGTMKYQKNIVESLSRLNSNHKYYVFINEALPSRFSLNQPNWSPAPIAFRKGLLWEQLQLPYYAHKFKLDLVHTVRDRLPYLPTVPIILFLFEIPHHRSQDSTEWGEKKDWYCQISDQLTLSLFPHSLACAKRILVSSESTKKDLVERFQVPDKKIKVTQPGLEDAFKPLRDEPSLLKIRQELGAPNGYILHFSTQDPRENTALVVRAFLQARPRLPKGMKLLVAGGGRGTEGVSEGVIHLAFLTGQSLVAVYQGASLYVDPSFYEGFGFQILEAMACGVPVIASNRTSIPEIVGDAGILIDPKDGDALGQAMIQVLRDGNLRDEMRRRGLERAKQFSWEKTAQGTLVAYEEILNER